MSNRRRLMLRQEAGGFDPSDLTDLYAWWDASDASTFTLGAGDHPTEWRDKSGGGYHLAGSGSSSNVARDGTQNGLATVAIKSTNTFVGAASSADWTWTTNGNTVYIEAVVLIDSTTSNPDALRYVMGTATLSGGARGISVAYDDRSSASRNDALLAGMNTTGSLRTFTSANGVCAANTWLRIAIQLDADTNPQSGWVDGVSFMNDSPAALTPGTAISAAFALGSPGAASSTSNLINGEFAEVIVCDAAISSGDRSALGTYLDTKWGL